MKKNIALRDLKHRVELCSAKDVITDGEIRLSRPAVFSRWAMIYEKKASMFGTSGYAIMQDRDTKTHEMVIRYDPTVNISSAAWIYEDRGVSSNRWFKVLAIKEKEVQRNKWLCLECRLVERGDDVVPPVADQPEPSLAAKPLPQGIRL